MDAVSFARQPILHHDGRLAGYELLAPGRPAPAGALGALTSTDLHTAGGGADVYLDVTPAALMAFDPLPFGPEGVVLELPASHPVDDALVARLRALAEAGYRFALDDLRPDSPGSVLLPLVEVVKLDASVATLGADDARRIIAQGAIPAAYDVETREQRDELAAAGFALLQGAFHCRPSALPSPPAAGSLTALRTATQVASAGDADALIEAISRDPGLSVRLLRFVNSAALGLRHRVSSVPHAVRLLGARTVRQWATLVLVAGDTTGPPGPLLITALARARTCEAIAERLGMDDREAYFMVGLLSVADALLDASMDDVLAELPLADDVAAALGRHEGGKGRALRMAIACERGAWDEEAIPRLDGGALCALHVEALNWADGIALGLEPGEVARAA